MGAHVWIADSLKNWSDTTAWDVGTVPTVADSVTFNSTHVGSCTVDGLSTWSGGTLTISAGYSGTITQSSGINMTTAAYSQAAGTFTGNAAATFTATTFAVSAGTFNQGGAFVSTTFAVTATGVFTGSSGTMSTTAVTFSGSGGGSTITATSGVWSLAGSWTQSTSLTTFTAHSGSINITAACTFNDTRSTFNTINFTTANAAITISASTTCPLGATPVTTVGTSTVTVAGTITWSGLWTHTGAITTNNGSTLTGTSTPTLSITGSLTITNVTTITNTIGTITATGATSTTFTDTSNLLSASQWIVSKTNATFVVAASTTAALGASPTTTTGTSTFTVTGTLIFSGTWTNTGAISISSSGTLTGTSTPVVLITNGGWTFSSPAVMTNPISITFNITTATGRTFQDTANSTYINFRRSGSGRGTLSILSSFTCADFRDNDASSSHTISFSGGPTVTVTTFTVVGASQNPVILNSVTPGSAYTLHGTGSALTASYVIVQDSTADVSPTWTADSHSVDAGGNTNWIFTPAGGSGSGGTGSSMGAHQGDSRRYRHRF